MQGRYSLFIRTTFEEATRFRRIKADFGTTHNTFKAILDVFERVGGTDIIKSQAAAEIGTFMTSDTAEMMYRKGRKNASNER